MWWRLESIEDCPGGNTMPLIGTGLNLRNSGKIADREEAHNILSMKLSVSLTVEKVVQPKNTKDMPILAEGLKLPEGHIC
jgi:elongation factor 2